MVVVPADVIPDGVKASPRADIWWNLAGNPALPDVENHGKIGAKSKARTRSGVLDYHVLGDCPREDAVLSV